VSAVDDDLVLVGHSAGGLTTPIVASARTVARLVFLSALLPLPGRPFTEQNRTEHVLMHEYQAGVEPDDNGCRRWFDAELCARTMYAGVASDDAAWAFAHLRAQSSTIYAENSPLERWPDLPITDIRGAADQIVSPAWAARAVPERLGVESIVIEGAGHSSMLSHPADLAALLLAR
jgi:pimeloyl-ACP methyl ester carboxylesterase